MDRKLSFDRFDQIDHMNLYQLSYTEDSYKLTTSLIFQLIGFFFLANQCLSNTSSSDSYKGRSRLQIKLMARFLLKFVISSLL